MITSCISNKLRGSSRRRLRRPGQTTPLNDSFEYNPRSELTGATLETTPFAYDYDNISNRETAQEAVQAVTNYITNPLNQYSGITQGEETPFTPEYDAAGNQTKVRTSTGIWSVVYDANNRPISLISEDGQSIVACGYDYMGRRYMKKVTVRGVVKSHHHYLYRGYLQIAALDLTTTGTPALWYTHWDPMEPIATRPLSIRKNGTWYTYGHDLTKNVTELYNTNGMISSVYDYTPYGAVTAADSDQPFQWSSEVYDNELGMAYYNYRHYNPIDGRWIGKDRISEDIITNKYAFINNEPNTDIDILGLYSWGDFGIDLLSAALVVADVILGGPTGEGIAPAIALQGMKTGAKIAAKEAAKKTAKEAAKKAAVQKAKEEAKKRAKRTAECELIHAQYDALSCKKCTQCMPCSEATKMLACWSAKAAGRKLFLDKKCDYYLAGSISFGSKAKESNHKQEYAKASMNIIQCTTIIAKNCK